MVASGETGDQARSSDTEAAQKDGQATPSDGKQVEQETPDTDEELDTCAKVAVDIAPLSLMDSQYLTFQNSAIDGCEADQTPHLAAVRIHAGNEEEGRKKQGITSDLKTSTKEYVQSPTLLGHEEPFLDRAFTQHDWDDHISFKRYLPEPLYIFQLCKERHMLPLQDPFSRYFPAIIRFMSATGHYAVVSTLTALAKAAVLGKEWAKLVGMLLYPLTMVLISTAGCAIYEKAIRPKQHGWPSLEELDAEFAYSLCSFALSLLLIFKTNTCFARFWEARTTWGAVSVDTRAFISQVQGLAPTAPTQLRQAIVRWTIALPYTLRSHLMDYNFGAQTLQEILTQKEVKWLRKSPWSVNRDQPLRAVTVLVALLKRTEMDPVHVMHLTGLLRNFLASCGACDTIKATPIPMAYTRHTTRFILIYTFFMPVVLWRSCEFATFLVAPLITLLLAGIDNIGIFIENPINILPMSSYCRVIHDNIVLAAHDWSLNNSRDAASLVGQSLEEPSPEWQLGKQHFAHKDRYGSIVDENAHSLSERDP